MRSGSVCNAISLPSPNEAGRQPTPCVPCLMPFSTSCAPVARGATCQRTFRRGNRCSIIFVACTSKAHGFGSSRFCEKPNANELEGLRTKSADQRDADPGSDDSAAACSSGAKRLICFQTDIQRKPLLSSILPLTWLQAKDARLYQDREAAIKRSSAMATCSIKVATDDQVCCTPAY